MNIHKNGKKTLTLLAKMKEIQSFLWLSLEKIYSHLYRFTEIYK